MTLPPLESNADDGARAQIRNDLVATLMVEAGAGTGKTRALVDRVVSLVRSGKPLEKIAAITFTEKAATELKDRIRSGLEDAKAAGAASSDFFEAALESLDRAQISTIHAFCQSVLRSLAARSGTDPSFVVSDVVRAQRRLQDRWRMYLDALVEDEAAVSIVHRGLGLGMSPGDLETLATELTARRELMTLLKQALPTEAGPSWPDMAEMGHALANLRINEVPSDDKLRLLVEGVASLMADVNAASPADRGAALASGAAMLAPRVNVSNKGVWAGRITEVRETLDETCTELRETLDAYRREALADLIPIIVRFVGEEARQRQRDGELTFDDLIICTRDILVSDARARASLRERFDVLLIDEFQDTDPLQVDIARAFGTDPATGDLESGRLFLVGDPKQSIYRFRRADMGMYSQTRQVVETGGGKFPVLSVNRRSRPEVLSWVNHVFETMIGDGAHPEIQPPYKPIIEDRHEDLAGPGVAFFGGEAEGVNARDVRHLEAGDAARVCRAAVDTGWEVWDAARKEVRAARYKDIALLTPTRNVLGPLEIALTDVGVPYRVEGGSLVYRTQEVRDVLNCLIAINDPDDEVAVVAALRSPAFACSDVDLALHKAEKGSFNYVRLDPEKGSNVVRDGLSALAGYHAARQDISLARLVERFVAERMIVEAGVLDRGDRNTFRRMRFVVEQARVFEANGPESLREFVSWLENCSTRDFLDNEGAGLDDDEDAVRILTIHGAKGLEFPIVLMVGMGAEPNENMAPYLANYVSRDVGISIGTKTDNRRFVAGSYEQLKAAELAHIQAEFGRLLYVAATRARDHLVVSLHRKKGATKSAAQRLEDAGARDMASVVDSSAVERTPRVSPLDGLKVDVPAYATVDEFMAAREGLVAASRRKLFTSATAEVRETKEGAAKEDGNDETEPWARGRGGTRLGRAVHAAIQSLDWEASTATIRAFANAQAVAEAIPHRSADVARLAERALRSEAADRARGGAKRSLREVPFAVQAGDVTLEGFIDLVIEDESGLEIVDWKTDQIGESEVMARLDEYRLQAGLYVWGLQEATGRRVQRVTYVFVSAGQEVTPGDPQELAESARRHLATKTAAPPPI